MISKIILFLTIISGLGVILMINFTSPSSVGPIGIFGFFAMMYVVFTGLISFFLYGVLRAFSIVLPNKSAKRVDFTKLYYFSTALAFAPIFFIAQQSLGRVGFFEFILIIFFEIIACIYISKR